MVRAIEAIYENGCLRLLQKLHLPEHMRLHIAILTDDIGSMDMAKLAEQGGAFDFLNNPEDDIYNLDDGEKVD
jgi:predicted DNA-binding antitoxin AbrB/MazE fold protein